MEKRVKNTWFQYGRKSGFGIGFDISRYCWYIDLGFWYVGQEF